MNEEGLFISKKIVQDLTSRFKRLYISNTRGIDSDKAAKIIHRAKLIFHPSGSSIVDKLGQTSGENMNEQSINVQPWNCAETPTESVIRQRFETEGLQPYSWSNGPGDAYAPHDHSYHKVIYVVSGSITFVLTREGRKVTLKPGDRLDLPQRTLHEALVGMQGVVCLEAHR
jgi:quercetin dioxygenase-like cupin family protein